MNKLQLYRLLKKHLRLSNRRSPMFEQNQYALLFGYIGGAIFCIYFIMIGTFLGWAAHDGEYELIFCFMPFLLILDFFMRFGMTQTPTMMVKPYLLLPIGKHTAIELFIISLLLSGFNWAWMSLFLPYTFICWCGGMQTSTAILLLCTLHLLVLINSQWYLLVRTLVNRSLFWWALPLALCTAIALPLILGPDKWIDNTLKFLFNHGFTWYSVLLYLALTVALFYVNRSLQMRFVYDEISRHEKTTLKTVSEFRSLNRFGIIGEYLKLEIKSTMRNKAIRARFIQGVLTITMLSLCLTFSETYTSEYTFVWWSLYCFLFFGAVNLVKLMGPEGNYIDLLMVHEENILSLLRAKYYFYCAITLLPLFILMPTVFSGKFSPLMLAACLFFTTGPNYWLLFQLAVYNKQTLSLNDKLTGKGQMENKLQFIVTLVVFFVPVFFVLLFTTLLGNVLGYIVVSVIGLAVTLAHPLWLRNIYRRMMLRRYQNIEGFHATR